MPQSTSTRHLLLAGFMALSGPTLACGGGPTSPSRTGPNVVRVDDPSAQFGAQRSAINQLIETALGRVVQALPVTDVTITVIPDASRAIGGYGVGGRTLDARTVEIYIDPAILNTPTLIDQRLPRMVAHELHHAARWRGPGYGNTLLEAMVSEGMADRFSVELLGVAIPPWSDALPRDRNAEYFALARPEFDSRSYSHSRWFFDSSPAIPRWTGYTLGFRLIEAYQAAHQGSTAAQLTNTPANAFRPFS